MRKYVREKGFTLVELAIVMVIIGLLVGAVLKGQAMVDDARGKRLINDMQGVSAAYFTYMDRYSAVPGDDTTDHGWAQVDESTNADGDGLIEGSSTTDTEEDHEVWQALRYAGLLTGDPTATGTGILPSNPFGGSYTLGNTDFGAGVGTRNSISAGNVPGTHAELFDIKLDDGVYNSGTVQGSAAYTSPKVTLIYGF